MEKPRASRPSGCTSLRWSTWGQQWWAMLGAFTVLIAMIILLDSFDGRPIFSWNGITLNTITSILSVTVKAAALFVIAECMAQWKWILFAKEQRPLIDFDRLDGATRGPMGSLRLILKTRGAYIAQFGAVLTLVALALDPFAQQLVQLRESIIFEPIANGSVSVVPRAQAYSSGDMTREASSSTGLTNETGKMVQWTAMKASSTATISATMEAAVSSGFFKSLEDVSRERFFYCLTGKCTFAPFLTLGVCHKSTDITSKLKHSSKEQDFNGTLRAFGTDMIGNFRAQHKDDHGSAFSLPNGHFMANIDGTDPISCKECTTYLTTSFGTENPNKTVTMRGIDTLIWSMSVIYPDMKAYNNLRLSGESADESKVWPNIPMLATESALYYCVKNVTASVVDNKFHEEVMEVPGVTRTIDSWDAALLDENNGTYQAPPEEARGLVFESSWSWRGYNDLQLQVPDHDGLFTVTPISVFSISAHLQSLFRWPDWHNSTTVRQRLEAVPGMAKAVAYNSAVLGPLVHNWRYQKAQPKKIAQLMSLVPEEELSKTEEYDKFRQVQVFRVIAEAMTNEIRRSSVTGDVGRNRSDTTFEEGQTGVQVVLYRVAWPWIGLHAAVLASTCLFMVLTIWSSGRSDEIPLWKSSSLGAIRRGHDIGDMLIHSGNTIEDMEATARKLKLKADRDDEASPTLGR